MVLDPPAAILFGAGDTTLLYVDPRRYRAGRKTGATWLAWRWSLLLPDIKIIKMRIGVGDLISKKDLKQLAGLHTLSLIGIATTYADFGP
jgi:hypothetical protein